MKRLLVIPILAAAAILVACSGTALSDEQPVTDTDTVIVKDNKFSPRVIEVSAGTEVTWRFEDNRLHDVEGEGWGSEKMQAGSFVHTFTEPGTYDYRCTLHGGMTGRVIVMAD